LGSFPDTSLRAAREKAAACRASSDPQREHGPRIKARLAPGSRTLEQVLEEYLTQRDWRGSNKLRGEWDSSIRNHCAPLLGRDIRSLTADDILGVLTPIWGSLTTASRIKARLEKLHEHACRARWADRSINLWPDVTGTLEHRQRPAKGHFAALPWQDVPGVFAKITNVALKFLILTATRSGEVRGATWDEVDLDSGLWVIPAERMKMRQPHRVPLSKQALAILRAQPQGGPGDLVFPGVNGMIDVTTFGKALQALKLTCTAHGFRSSARDWMREAAKVPHDVAEQCLAHKIGSAVMQAYLRGDLLDERRPVMQQWADYCTGADHVSR